MAHTYAVADLHGRLDLLEAAIRGIEADAAEPSTVVFLGDYVDRGPQSRGILERLMQGASNGSRWVCLKGNHEDMMATCLRGQKPISWWLENGGTQTMISYDGYPRGKLEPSAVPMQHLAWIDALPLMHVDRHRVFVHAGVDPARPLDEQEEGDLLWKRNPRTWDLGHGGKHVVHGHHPYEDGPLLLSNRTDLDTLAWHTGRLCIGVFDDEEPGGPVRLIELRGRPQRD